MKLTKSHWALVALNVLYVIGFGSYYVINRNYEFLWYVAVLVFFFGLIGFTLKRSHFPLPILLGLSFWGLLHMAGGGIRIGDHVLYAQHLIPIIGSGEMFILKYDQVVHAFGFFVSTLVVYHLLKPYLNERTNWKVVYPILVVAGTGIGVLNEIVEFIAVIVASNNGVGGYGNTLLDLCFNTLGAIIGVFVIHFFIRQRKA